MAGDIGFDPLQISDLVPLQWAREVRARPRRSSGVALSGGLRRGSLCVCIGVAATVLRDAATPQRPQIAAGRNRLDPASLSASAAAANRSQLSFVSFTPFAG
jgi:hypothetical protein